MNTDGDGQQDASQLGTAIAVRDALLMYMAETLRNLPSQSRVFLHLPRNQVGTDWSRWSKGSDPVPHGQGLRYDAIYQFFPGGEWDPIAVSRRFGELWRIWGWECASPLEESDERSSLTASSMNGWEFDLKSRRERRGSTLRVTSPEFPVARETPDVAMPFAVTPFGGLSLAHVWLTYPELMSW